MNTIAYELCSVTADAIHGDKSQRQRDGVLNGALEIGHHRGLATGDLYRYPCGMI